MKPAVDLATRGRALLHHLLRPGRGNAAGVVLVFAVLLTLAAEAGLLGLPLALLLLSWYFKYAYILFDQVVRGFDEPPPLDIAMLNPLDEQRPLGQVAILALAAVGLAFVAAKLSPALAWVLGVLALLVLPASVAVLGLEGNPFKAVNPIALARMIAGLGPLYAALLGVIGVVGVVLRVLVDLHLWLLLELAATLFAFLAVFSALGGALYEQRDELGLETWHSPERTAAKERHAALKLDDQEVTEAYAQVRIGAHAAAWARLQALISARGRAPEDYRWVRDKTLTWPDARYATRLTEEYVDRLLELKRTGEALDAVAERLRADPAFRPKSSAATLVVAQLAARGGGAPAVARLLLSDFAGRFANDERLEIARDLARHLGE